MADVNDTGNVGGRLKREIELIDGTCSCSNNAESALECGTCELGYADADHAALTEYATWRRRHSSAMNTARLYISAVRLSMERYDGLLTGVDGVTEVERVIDAHEAAGCKAAGSLNAKLDGLRDFWRWCESTEYGLDDYRWVTFVKNVEPNDENPGTPLPDPSFILDEAEITALREAARNNRDKALIEFLADTGARITLATQLKRRCVDIDATPPTYRPNPDGVAHKDVATKDYVLRESTRHLRIYLRETHPDDHPEAPLFALEKGYDESDREHSALGRGSASDRLEIAADMAGIDRERARPHQIRKAAVVRMRLKHGMSWDGVQKRMEWSDQSLPEMKEVYHAIDNSDEIEMVARELGYEDFVEDVADATTDCWNCGREILVTDSFCRGCGVDPEAEPAQAQLGRALTSVDTATAKRLLEMIEAVEAAEAEGD